MWSSTAGWNKRSSVPDQLLHGAPGLRSACFSLLLRVIVQCRTIVPIVHEHLRSLLRLGENVLTPMAGFKEFLPGDVDVIRALLPGQSGTTGMRHPVAEGRLLV